MTTNEKLTLKNDRLTVEIARPGSIYTGTRFDWTAFITQVTLDQTHTFCVPESDQPGQGTGGVGLCNEFGIEQAIGYDAAHPGECFPKFGIGLLVKPEPRLVAERAKKMIEVLDIQAGDIQFKAPPTSSARKFSSPSVSSPARRNVGHGATNFSNSHQPSAKTKN